MAEVRVTQPPVSMHQIENPGGNTGASGKVRPFKDPSTEGDGAEIS